MKKETFNCSKENPTRLIYFPAGHEPGMKNGLPIEIWAIKEWEDLNRAYITASKSREEATMGKYMYLPRNRCLRWNPARWQACSDFISQFEQIEKRRKALQKEIQKIE